METPLLLFFLAFTMFALIINAALLVLMYRAFSNMTAKVTQSIRDFQSIVETKEWLDPVLSASEFACELTEATKERIRELDPVLVRTHDKYGYMLAKADKKLEDLSSGLAKNTVRVRDAVARPAYSIGSFAAGLATVLASIRSGEDGE